MLDTAKVIADPLVRNKATVGGNLAHADPANDHPAAMLAYDAQIVARSPTGNRTIAIDDLFVGLFETSLAARRDPHRDPDPEAERRRAAAPTSRSSARSATTRSRRSPCSSSSTGPRHARQIQHIGIRIGLTNVSAIPQRAKAAEAALTGKQPTDDVLEAAGRAAAAECDPSADLRGQVDYKRDMVRVLTKRAVRRAVQRAQGGRP